MTTPPARSAPCPSAQDLDLTPVITNPARARTRTCQVLTLTRRGSNRCESPAVDPLGAILLCIRHMGDALEVAGQQPGIHIELIAPEPEKKSALAANCSRPALGEVPPRFSDYAPCNISEEPGSCNHVGCLDYWAAHHEHWNQFSGYDCRNCPDSPAITARAR